MSAELLLTLVATFGAGLLGSGVAVLVAIKLHAWRLDEQKALLLEHSKKHESHEKRLTVLETKGQVA